MSEVKSILLVGVGGQGTILVSKLLTAGLIKAGYDVKMSEIHGMSQRGGNVSTQVRYGEKVYSPIVGVGEADVIVAFEKMEALRWLEYLKPDGKMVVPGCWDAMSHWYNQRGTGCYRRSFNSGMEYEYAEYIKYDIHCGRYNYSRKGSAAVSESAEHSR